MRIRYGGFLTCIFPFLSWSLCEVIYDLYDLGITYSMRYRMTNHTASERQSAGAGTTAGTPLAGYSGSEERDGIPDSR